MNWEVILKRGRTKLSAERYRIMREIVADTIAEYDEFEQYELTDLFLERYRERLNEEIKNPTGDRRYLTPVKVRNISTRMIKNIGTHELEQRGSPANRKRYWVRK